jgi:hypothetical protein
LGEKIDNLRGKDEASAQSFPRLGSVPDRFRILGDYFAIAGSNSCRQAAPGTGKAREQMLKRMAKRMSSVWANAAALL